VDKHFFMMMTLWTQLQAKAEELGEHLDDRRRGQGLVEYSFIIVFVSVAAIVGLGIMATGLNSLFTNIGACVTAPSTTTCSLAALGG
jgi:Flp pilus assembly pilin Flp